MADSPNNIVDDPDAPDALDERVAAANQHSSGDYANHPPIGERDPVPRLPRQKGWGVNSGEIFRIGLFAALLVAVVVLGRPCADGMGRFVGGFTPGLDAGAAARTPKTAEELLPSGTFVRLNSDDTPEEVAKKIRAIRGQAEAAARANKMGDGGIDPDSGSSSPSSAPGAIPSKAAPASDLN